MPAWVFGNATYHVLLDGRLLALYCGPGQPGATLALVDPSAQSLTDIATGGALAAVAGPWQLCCCHVMPRPLAAVLLGQWA